MTTTKRCISLLLVLCLLLSVVPVTAYAATANDTSGDDPTRILNPNNEKTAIRPADIWDGSHDKNWEGRGTKIDPYLIYTPEELAGLADQVKKGNIYSGKYFRLMNDLYLNDTSNYENWSKVRPANEWVPIGVPFNYPGLNEVNNIAFEGHFDGDNHTVFGLYCNRSVGGLGLFGYIEDGSISNLNVSEAYVLGDREVALLCGGNDYAAISNCHASGTVISNGNYSGGVVASAYKADITGCTFSGKVNGNTKNYAGGIVGSATETGISGCINYGVISGSEMIGGIVGNYYGPGDFQADPIIIEKCYNGGKITGMNQVGGIIGLAKRCVTVEKCCNTGAITGDTYVGGISGSQFPGTNTAVIQNCFNTGGISGSSYVGGMTGILDVTHSEGYIITCYNVGSIHGTSDVGSVVGYASAKDFWPGHSEVMNCVALVSSAERLVGNQSTPNYDYSISNPNQNEGAGNALRTEDEMKLEYFYTGWDFGSIWGIDPAINNGYPHLRWMVEEDTEIINRMIVTVRAYTEEMMSEQYQELLEKDYPPEVMLGKLNEFWSTYGMADVREGIDYLHAAQVRQGDYNLLLNDEYYCANNYADKVKSNLAMRLTLGATALLVGGEINSWMSFDTYLQEEYPGVKKYKAALLSFMNETSYKLEALDMAKKVQNLFESTNSAVEYDLIRKLEQCKDVSEYQNCYENYVEKGFYAKMQENDGGTGKVSFVLDESSGFGKFAKAMDRAGDGLKVVNMAYEDAMAIINLDSTLDTYMYYEEFLREIVNSTEDFPYEMRWAASQILDDMEQEWKAVAGDVVIDLIDAMYSLTGLDSVVLDALEDKYAIAKGFSGWTATVNITSMVINWFVDVGAMVEKSAWVEAYALLADHWKVKLIASAEQFQADKTINNAWEFAECYEMMRNIRLQGEECYLAMCNLNGALETLFEHQYVIKRDFVNETIKRLNSMAFSQYYDLERPVGNSQLYAAKSVVDGNADVTVTDAYGNVIIALEENEECDVTNKYGRFVSMYQTSKNRYVKILYFKEDAPYIIRLHANRAGLVNYDTYGSDRQVRSILQQTLTAGTTITITADVKVSSPTDATVSFSGDEEDDGPIAIVTPPDEGDAASIESISIPGALTMYTDESVMLTVTISPIEHANTALVWNSSNPGVATVINGVVTPISNGTAKITVNALGSDLVAECIVTVEFCAQGHTEAVIPAVAPTCTESGLSEGRCCSVCDAVLVAQEVVAAPGHTEFKVDAVAPTFDNAGLTEGKICAVCGEILLAQQTIPMLDYNEGTIPLDVLNVSVGDYEMSSSTEGGANLAVDDNFSTMWHTNWRGTSRENHWFQFELTDADYVVTGLRYKPRVTGNNNGTITEYDIQVSDDGVIFHSVATGSWDANKNWKVVSFDAQTVKYVRLVAVNACTDNRFVFASAAEIRLVGTEHLHSYDSVVTAPTCTEDGYTTYTCTVCGDSYTEAGEAAKGHSYDVTAEQAPTCTEDGYTTYTCACGDSYTEVIPATGHSFQGTADTRTCACGEVFSGVYNDYLYIKGTRLRAYQLVEFEGSYYFVSDGHKIAKNTRIYLSERFVSGTPFAVGTYVFDAEGKMSAEEVKNGVVGDYLYIDNVKQLAYKLVEFEGNYYFINDGHKIARNCKLFLSERFVTGTPFAVGYYEFDADGKMVKNGVIGDYLYIDGEKQLAYKLVEFGGSYYFVSDAHKIARNTRIYLSERFVGGTSIPVGYYEFDADGKMIIPENKHGVVGDYLYINNVKQLAYKLVEFEGNTYFVSDGNKIARNVRIYLSERFVSGTSFAPGFYEFDADGHMIIG